MLEEPVPCPMCGGQGGGNDPEDPQCSLCDGLGVVELDDALDWDRKNPKDQT